MTENIRSIKVKKVNDAINYKKITEKELNVMAQFTEQDLVEFFYCINDGTITTDILAYYFVVFDYKLINKIETKYKFKFIDELLSKAWVDNIIDIEPNEVLQMLLGLSIINTNLISRIRNGLISDSKTVKSFDNHIESIIKELINYAEKNLFVSIMTGADIKDNEDLNGEEISSILLLKDDILNLANVFELYDITHNHFKNKEYLSKDSNRLNDYENNLRKSIQIYFSKVNNVNNKFIYLPNKYNEIIIDLISNVGIKADKNRSIKGLDSLDNISAIEKDDEPYNLLNKTKEDELFNYVSRKIDNNGKTKSVNEKIKNEPLNCSDMIINDSFEKQQSSGGMLIKIAVIILLVLALIGWGLSLRSNNENGIEHVKNLTHAEILSYKLSSGGEANFDMKIQRSGIKENGTINTNIISSEIN